jgi:hypothetical protein
MKWMNKSCFPTAFLFVAAGFIQQVQAAPVVFTIDQSQSQVSAAGKVAGSTFSAQAAGSLTTSYSGNINADVSGSTIQFTGGSAIAAQNSGDWKPAAGGGSGSASADYGAKATYESILAVYVALRNIVLDLNSPSLAVTGGNFDGSSLIFSFATNTAALDYNYSIGSGSQALDGYSTNTLVSGATVSINGNVQTLTIPIDTTFIFSLLSANDSSVHLTGQIVATSSGIAPPVIHSLTVTNQNVAVTAGNATTNSLLLVSTNLLNWSSTSANITTNDQGWIIFTTPMNGPQAFFRVEQ